jgi:hypothetical protein
LLLPTGRRAISTSSSCERIVALEPHEGMDAEAWPRGNVVDHPASGRRDNDGAA